MAVAVIPASFIEQVEDVVALSDRRVRLVVPKCVSGQRDNQAISRCYDFGESFGPSDIQAVVIIDLLSQGAFAGVDIRRLVGHLRVGGKPPLLYRVADGSGSHPWRARRP